MSKQYSDEDRQTVLDRVRRGASWAEAAGQICSKSTAQAWAKEAGIDRRPVKSASRSNWHHPNRHIPAIRAMHKAGRSIREIAKTLNRSDTEISSIVSFIQRQP